jgi:SRSO17 transposase
MRPSSQVPIETHAAIYSVSLIIIFKIVGSIFTDLPNVFQQQVYHSFIIFLTGLCIRDKNQTANGIAKFFGISSHDALTRMLSHKCWSASLLMLELLHQAINLFGSIQSQSYLILDDVILPKNRSSNTVGVYWDWDSAQQKYILCMRLVVLAWTNGSVMIPVAFAPYYKKDCEYLKIHRQKFRTKNQLAQALVYQLVRKGLRFDYLLFDSWYSSADNFNLFNRLNIHFVTSIKSNRTLQMPFCPLEYRPQRKTKNCSRAYELIATKWAALKPYVRDYHFYASVSARARKQEIFVKHVNFLLKMVCIKNYATNPNFKSMHTKADKKAKDRNKYLLTNDLELTIPAVIRLYRCRWSIEVMFRDCKQNFALGKCQAHKSITSHLRHTAMAFFAFSIMELLKSKRNITTSIGATCGEIKQFLQNQQLIYVNGEYQIVDTTQFALEWTQVNELTKLIDLKELNNAETQLVLNFKI